MTHSIHSIFAQEFLSEIKFRIFEEGLKRVVICLDQLSEDQIWWRPNDNSNAIGNQVLHLEGNLRQYIMHGVGRHDDVRNRDREFNFSQSDVHSKTSLQYLIEQLTRDINDILDHISPDDWMIKRNVQCYEFTVIGILIHVTEHLSYHVGQITYITKMLLDQQVGYYEGLDLG